MSSPPREPGTGSPRLIANRYEIDLDHPLDRGGMATVYLGEDLKMRRRVAVKTLRPEYQRDPDSRHRFRREARMMAAVPHPNLVTIYDFRDENSGSWIVMEYVEGRTLRQILDEEGPLDPESVMVIIDQVGKGLSQMHASGVVHLDLKPQNLIWSDDGKVTLIDFGVAQRAGTPQEMIGGTAFGTVAYLAPEQASGRPVEAATDVYALGCVVYELLTGRTPFVAEGADHKRQLIDAHLNQRPPAPSTVRPELGLPSWIDDVLGWALAKDPRERFHSVDTFVRMFEAGLDGDEVRAPNEETRRFTPAREEGPTGLTRIFRRGPSIATGTPVIEEEIDPPITEVAPLADSPVRRLYRRGGRLARRARGTRRTLWRMVAMFAIANLILAFVLMARDGPAVLVERFLSFAPGTSTVVVTENLNVRSAPGTTSPVVYVLAEGDEVRVTGLSEEDEQGRWWPVEIDTPQGTLEGWAWEGGLRPNAWTGRLSWMQDIVDGVNDVGDRIGSGVDRVRGILPGGQILLPAPSG